MLRFLLKRKIIVGLFITLIFGLGFYGVTNLDKELFPSVTFNQTLIVIETEEMPAEDVEQFVTIPVEQVLENTKGVDSYESTTSTNDTFFIVDLENDNSNAVSKEIENEINGLTNELYGVKNVTVMQASTQGQYEFFMDISGGTLKEMSDFASDIVKPRLEALKEVNEVAISGLEEKEITITLKPKQLETYEITQEDIISAIEQSNTNTSIGSFKREEGDPSLRWNTKFNNINDIKAIQIQTNEGMKKLLDFANVKEETSEQTNVAWKNGNPEFLLLQIGRSNGFTQIDMAEAIRAEVEKIEQEHDNHLQIEEIAAQADYVTSAIDGVTSNILIGGIIAVIVLLLFLRSFRATFIIGLSIPASVLLAVITMTFLDYSFNLLSLVGLGLGIGMLVDASIVVLESIFKKKEEGYSNVEAVISGTKEVVGAVISSMLTTIVVFVPIVLLDDEIGKMMIVLTVVIAVTLISSVIVAFTLIPVLSENFLKARPKKVGKLNLIGKYGRIIEWLTKKKRRRLGVLTLFILLFFSSFLLLAKIPMTLMPDILNRYAEVIVELEPGVSTDDRAEIALKMNEVLEEIPDVDNNVILDNTGAFIALINMTPEEEKTMDQDKINEQILDKFQALESDFPVKSVGAAMDGTINPPIGLRVSGENITTLQTIAEDVKEELEKLESIKSVMVQNGESAEEVLIELNESNMNEDNISAPHLYMNILEKFTDTPVGEMVVNGNSVPILVKNDQNIHEKQDLLDNKIMTVDGEKKLSNYISLKEASSQLQIDRSNGKRYISITADMEGQDLGAVNREINKIIQVLDIDRGYTVELTGDLEEQQKAAQDLVIIFAISLFLVFVVMAIQFNSLKHPIIILFIIPLTITGVLIGLFISQKELNIMSGIGVIMLIGIVLNNGILLIDRVRQLRNNGLDVNEAMVNAAQERIRPIFMTTLTTVGGMLPLALATGTSSDYQSPLAVVIISGLLFSTFITLILIPAVYLLFEDIGNGMKRIFRRKKSVVQVTARSEAQ
ncbi:efflux RND transporter permease subunit [Pseudogracilibacillus sp. SE30717A]|uniref:efflux RND transporter permease subunit n=1 Tax=Pseudogracilibacillus sp. SE30717A TaxID=3098293 RepID=UPI00300DD575